MFSFQYICDNDDANDNDNNNKQIIIMIIIFFIMYKEVNMEELRKLVN